MNKVILIGNVGRNPEVKDFLQDSQQGFSTAKFSLATSKKVKDKTETQWHNIEVIGKTGNGLLKVIPYIKMGSKIMVEGEIRYSQYNKDGQTRYMTSIVAGGIELLTKKEESKSEDDMPMGGQDDFLKSLL